MTDIVLIHWNAEEAKERARILKALGHKTRILSEPEKPELSTIRESPPDLFLIDLTRLPFHGREIGGYFRRTKATRQVPTLFAGGDSGRVASARRLIPDAAFGKWDNIEAGIVKAIKNAPSCPTVPDTRTGHSGTPLAKKLGIRETYAVLLVNSPDRFERTLEPLPAGVEFVEDGTAAHLAVLFAQSEAGLVRDFRPLGQALPKKVTLWIAWPKKSSGIVTDLTDGVVRQLGLSGGWVDYKVCAIDETWSGLCFARKR